MRKLDENQKEKLKELISNRAAVLTEYIHVDSNLVDDLGCDSLDKIEILMDVEKEFNICIPDADFEEVETVSDMYMVVERYL